MDLLGGKKMIIVYVGAGVFCIGLLLFMAGIICNISVSNKLGHTASHLCHIGTITAVCGGFILAGGVFYALLTDPTVVLTK